jgi:phosphoribosylaminoimidazole (AIR) synthetase
MVVKKFLNTVESSRLVVNDDISALFNEELGCVIQVSNTNKATVINALSKAGLANLIIDLR